MFCSLSLFLIHKDDFSVGHKPYNKSTYVQWSFAKEISVGTISS